VEIAWIWQVGDRLAPLGRIHLMITEFDSGAADVLKTASVARNAVETPSAQREDAGRDEDEG